MRVRDGAGGNSADSEAADSFLDDGVAPPVIGGGPPESPFGVEPDSGRGDHVRATSYGPDQDEVVAHRAEPPTAPIPAVHRLPPEQEPGKRKSWVARMFRLPDR